MSTGTTDNSTKPLPPPAPHPVPGVTPVKLNIPAIFESAEARAAAWASTIETHLQSLTLPTLLKIQAALTAGTMLPFGLDAFRADVLAFLAGAIAVATDAITIAQMISQLGLIQSATVATA